MKICFITSNIFNLGGVERVVSVLGSELSKNDDVTVLCYKKPFNEDRDLYNLDKNVNVKFLDLDNSNIVDKILYKGIRYLHKKDILKFNREILFNAYYNYNTDKLLEYINENNFDAVIGVEGRASILLASIADRLSAKVIGWEHNSYDAYFNTPKRYYWKQKEIFKEYLNKLDCCVVLTEDDRQKFISEFNCKCITIYNPLSFRTTVKADCKEKNIIFVGRLLKQQKGIDLLIEAFNEISHSREDWILNIVGDGPDKEWLINKIDEYGLNDKVRVLGATDNVQKYFLESSIFVSTSRWEGFGLVITEAMECGLPIVAFNNSGPREIINNNGYNGILIENHDFSDLAKNVIALIDDYDRRRFISENAIKRARDFSSEIILEKWTNLLMGNN